MNTPEEYFKKWAANCRIFTNYKAIHSHEDMMRFAKDYHNEQLRLNGVSRSAKVKVNEPFEIEETGEKYMIELNTFVDDNDLWDRETIIVRLD